MTVFFDEALNELLTPPGTLIVPVDVTPYIEERNPYYWCVDGEIDSLLRIPPHKKLCEGMLIHQD